ncbi:adenylate/guanylate cyclase domain-containing protein [Rhizobium sp. 18065]|uniref:adenylate/guanylate cyclase domain-containing protein n=1 Tax=Rhizobium sp. 18065 TaxID=2681411 RepID=UPI001357D11C|nr:adenylate/guanylate cyclase domain-containing protein [Rhizobium sp. 18065]
MKKVIVSERTLRDVRLASGLVIFIFIALHMLNHAVGLISVETADHFRRPFLALWRNPIATVLLYGSLLIHFLLVLRAIYIRRNFVMPKSEAAQILLGLMIPLLLIPHIVGTRVANELFDYRDTYAAVVTQLWISSPVNGVQQSAVLVIAWLHGCIGLHFWLRYRTWYGWASPWLLVLAIMLPVLALLGFSEMGRTIQSPLGIGRGYPGGYYDPTAPSASTMVQLAAVRMWAYATFAFSLVALLLFRLYRKLRERVHRIAVRYPDGQVVHVPRGFSILEASRLGGVPHYAACGGKGQCSTCRVQVVSAEGNLPAIGTLEQRTLIRIKPEPGVRLACQLRPTGNLTVAPLLVAMPDTMVPANSQEISPGRERDIAVLFCDLRNFTTLTESRLPFDIVFLLNRYFAVVGHAVEETGGQLDKFIGDGAMALFGINTTPEEGCRQALEAAHLIIAGIEELNVELANDFSTQLQIAIGIHSGHAVVGTLGYGRTKNMTAIGDTVNVASRLEAVAKQFNVPLVVSEPVARLSGVDLTGMETHEVSLRGRELPLNVFIPLAQAHAASA